MKFRINDLTNFLKTTTAPTMSEAARQMGITQPALSESIKRLEKDLGQNLFYRTKSGISLSPWGKILLEKSKPLTFAINDVESIHKNNPNQVQPRITIGCHAVVAAYTLPKAFLLLENIFPHFTVDIIHGASRVMQNYVQQGKVDIAVVINAVSAPDLVIKKVSQDDVCVWKKRGLNEPPPRLICNTDIYQTLNILRKWKNYPTDMINSESLELISYITAKGLGYGIIPNRTIDLLKLPLEKVKELPTYKDLIYLTYRPEFGKSEYERAVIESLAAALTPKQ